MAGCKEELIYALDIGTRSIIGVVGELCGGRLKVLAMECAEHEGRAMKDGQIDNIRQVAELARSVTKRLEERLGVELKRVSVAAAGRSLQTQRGEFCLDFGEKTAITQEVTSRLEAGAVSHAEEALQKDGENWQKLLLVGYTVAQYRLDNYPLHNPLEHKGQKIEADIVATFLPSEVVESLYAAMKLAELQIVSVTLEPIAAMNAAIPADLRLLNLALVDIGAGTTDIAVCRDGTVVGYTMATIAGDEITETIMRAFLVDFATAEKIKCGMNERGSVSYCDVLGMQNELKYEEFAAAIREPMERLADAIAKQVMEVNTTRPSAVFLAGGGSKLEGLRDLVASRLGMDDRRVAVAGNNFAKSAFSDTVELDNPEYTTPLGIAVSAGLGLLNDNYIITINGEQAKLFRSGVLTVQDLLLMNGYTYQDMIGRSGRNLTVMLDGKRMTLRGEPAVPALLRLNGEDCTINAVVNAGDEITFVPAKPGTDASKTVGELLQGHPASRLVLVNGMDAEPDYVLENNDVVMTTAMLPHKEEKAADPAPTALSAAAENVAENPSQNAMPAQEDQPSAAATVPTAPAAPVRQRNRAAGDLELTLNNEPLLLSPKEDGQPYYLMDLLQLSGIDFEHLDKMVKLEVNGEEQGFRFVLSMGDKVDIYCP